MLESKDAEITRLLDNQKHLEEVIVTLTKIVKKDETDIEKLDAELQQKKAETLSEGI